ncbi:hypothetical protein DFAR_3720007 [Desulfarculales bacterium]
MAPCPGLGTGIGHDRRTGRREAHTDHITKTIKDLKQAQGALRLGEDRFRLSFQASPDVIAITRLSDGHYLDINEGFVAITGYSRKEVIGRITQEIGIYQDSPDRQRLVAETAKPRPIKQSN